MRFGVPKEVVNRACRKYTKTVMMLSDIDLCAEYKGLGILPNGYALSKVGWVTKTLASKSVPKVSKRYKKNIG